jgi:hypothetical protein
MRSSSRNRKRSPSWRCQHCGRPDHEIGAAHRLDAIRAVLYGVGVGGHYAEDAHGSLPRQKLRPCLRTIAKRLRAPYLPLLQTVSDELAESDLTGFPVTTCTAAPKNQCGNTGAKSDAALSEIRARAIIETLDVLFDEVENFYDSDALASYGREFAEALGVPYLILEVVMSRHVNGGCSLAAMDEFNAWRETHPEAVRMLQKGKV